MAGNEAGKDRIIQELITHINNLEQKINTLREELDKENDLQTVNRLDIINLRNEIEKIRISLPALSSDAADKAKGAEKQDNAVIRRIRDDIEQLKKMVHDLNPEVIEEMQGEISALYEAVSRQPSGKTRPNEEMAALKKRLNELESRNVPAPRCRKCGALLKPGTRFCGKCGKKL